MNTVTNNEFLEVIFATKPSDARLWINAKEGNPKDHGGKFWSGYSIHSANDCDADFKSKNAYFSVSYLNPMRRRTERKKDNFGGMALIVLDDANNINFTPTYKLETSPNNYQVGLVLDKPIIDIEQASRLMEALAKQDYIKADSSGNNIVRYVRLPNGSNGKFERPYRHQMIDWHPDKTFTLEEVCKTLGLDYRHITSETTQPTTKMVSVLPKPTHQLAKDLTNIINNNHAVNDLARANFDSWVPSLFPFAKKTAEGYRISSSSLGRPLEEDISIHQDGIKDFGIADQGDLREGKRTAIELVAEHRFGGIHNQVAAEVWLRDKLGLEPIQSTLAPSELELFRAGTEHSIALALEERFKNKLKYNVSTKEWLLWDGKTWVVDALNTVFHHCRQISTVVVHNKNAHKSPFFRGVEIISRSSPSFAITANAFDADNYLLNTPDGIVDLRTGDISPHKPELLLSKMTSVGIANDYGTRFPQFLKEITCEDKELEVFLQVSLGACLSGAMENHWLLFWIGTGRNGKNTLGDAVMNILGDYARKVPSTILMKKNYEAHPTEIAQLFGSRLAIGSEVEQSAFWSESKLNELTGDEKISARFIGGNFFEFPKTFKFLIYGNHRPRLNSITQALKSRIKMVRFNADFSQNGDPELPSKLRNEYPNILRWLIDGHKIWLENGMKLTPCKAVEDELEDYMSSQATVDNWIEDFVTETQNKWISSKVLFDAYLSWKHSRGENPSSQVVWSESMKKRFIFKRNNSGIIFEVELNQAESPLKDLPRQGGD
jgi:putative DNA primase/helicase